MSQPASSNVIKIISGSRGKFPIKLGLIPDQLAVTIYRHDEQSVSGAIPCWSYLTEGLTRLQQKEILLTLRINPEEDINKFPAPPLQIFVLIYKLATQQKTIDIGDILKFGTKGLFKYPGAGFTFPLNNPTGLPIKRPTLSCILLTVEEFTVAQACGFTRVQSRLGYEQDHYPCLAWNHRERQSLHLRVMLQQTVLKSVERLPLKHSACYMEGGETVVLNIPSVLRTLLGKSMVKTPIKPLCLLTSLLPGHDGCLAWLPHKDVSQIVNADNSTGEFIGGSFLLLTPGQASDGAMMLEDGFSAALTDESWRLMLTALKNGSNVLINGKGGNMNIALVITGNKLKMEQPFTSITKSTGNEEEKGGALSRWFKRLTGR